VGRRDPPHRSGLTFDLGAAVAGLAQARWPGRLQWIEARPPLLLDGAHNPAGARVLAAELAGRGPFVLVFGAMQDKAIEEVGGLLLPLAREVVLTSPLQARAATPESLAERLGALAQRAHREPSVPRALDLARRLTPPDGFVAVAGSLFLIGEALALLERRRRRWPALR
jgi:dihydrofolate synthase/folylpolyglutamate synthase